MRRFTVFALAGLISTVAISSTRADSARARKAIVDQVVPEIKFNGSSLKDCLEFFRDATNANIVVNWKAVEAAGVSQDTPINMRVRDVTLRKALSMLVSEASGGDTLSFYMAENVIHVSTREQTDKILITRIYPVEDLLVEVPDFTNPPDLSLTASSTGGSSGRGGGGGGGGGSKGGGGGGGGGGANGLFGQGSGGGGAASSTDEKTMTREQRAEALLNLIRSVIYPDIWKENGGPASISYFSGKLIVTAPRSVQEAIGGDFD